MIYCYSSICSYCSLICFGNELIYSEIWIYSELIPIMTRHIYPWCIDYSVEPCRCRVTICCCFSFIRECKSPRKCVWIRYCYCVRFPSVYCGRVSYNNRSYSVTFHSHTWRIGACISRVPSCRPYYCDRLVCNNRNRHGIYFL